MGAKELNAAQQELFEAVRKGDVDKVHTWLSNKRNKRPRTPLNFLRPTTPQTAWLCSMVDPSNGYTVLHLAALQGHAEVIKMLVDVDTNMLNARDRRGCLPVHLAAWNGHVEAVQVLIDAEPDSVDAVNNAKESPLHLSAQHGHGKVVTALLAKHADARLRNARAETALDIAARLGKANVCRLIICNCPELALQSAAECSSTDSGRSRHVAQVAYPLHAAARHGHIDCLHILCQSGFDLDYVTEEGSALHVAALFGKVEAVKLLLEQGISVETRDSQGRTVLETLREHESEKASDLTQVIQSREGWSECRKLIEAHVARLTASLTEHKSTTSHSCAMTTSNDSCGAYQNVAQCSKYKADSKDVVWRPIPEGSTVRRQCAHSPRHSRNVAVVSSNGIYHPPSLLADVVTLSSDGHEFDGVSTLSLSTTLPDPSEHDSSGQPSPSSSGMATVITNQIPRFPLTSPNNKGRHTSSNRSVNVQPRMGLARASLNSGLKAGCSYQAPHLYDAWCPHRVTGYDNVIPPPHPLMAYDNVPRNLLVYDNAPPPGHRRWEHCCGSNSNCTVSTGQPFYSQACCVRSDGTQTMPPVKPTRARPALQANTFKPEPPSHLERSVDTTEESHDRVSTRSERANSTASVVTFACSTLERSVSPDGVNRTPSGTQSLAHGRAPLALPEDVCGSTSTSIMSTSMSPERCVTSDEKSSWRRSGTGTDENSASDKASSSTVGPSTSTQTTAVCMKFNGTTTDSMKSSVEVSVEAPSSSRERGAIDIDVGDLPSPETTKSRIHEFLCSHEELKKRLSLSPSSSKAQQTKTDALSPSTTDCSDCTLASSCSLPIISQISSTPPSVVSPTRERSQVSKQCSTEDPSLCSVEVRLRTQPIHLDVAAHRGAVFHVKNNHRTSSEGCCHSDMSGFAGRTERLKGSMQRASSNDVGDERQHTSLNESIEWKKINEIMESFGGAICRESVFADQYEPRVAVYLRDRRSQALTLQLSGPQPYQQAQHQAQRFQACGAAATVAAADRCSRRSPTTTAVADWLNVSVGIPNPRAKEIAAILESHGFDNVDHMQSTLDRLAMHEIGLDKSTQHQIGTYLDNYPGQRNASANTFTYVSDWLHSLDLEDYLGHFMNGGLTSMLIVSALDPSSKHLKSLGITSLGHQRRILNSLKEAKIERRQRAAEKVNAAMHDDETDSGQESRSTAQSSSASTQKPHSIIVGGRQTEWRHSSTTLIEDCVSYSAHYLGSMEISNIEGTEDSRRAMIKLKKGIREIAKVPQVLLEISVAGVRVLDATTKQLTVEHEITRIQIVCQDERDLNCFAYISQDGDKHFCHVFCVLTADVATEIIITLGQAFEVCYRIANGTYGGPEPIVINPVS